MAVRKLIQIGEPALKAKNNGITSFSSPKIKKLLKDLKETMYEAMLVGIAAPQIGENYRVFITHARNTKNRKLPKTDKFRIYINPRITYLSKSESVIFEGCGSVVEGGLFGPVKRPREVEVQAYDEKGEKFSLRCDGLLARVILHEHDHLQGGEFIQKVSDYKQLMTEDIYRKKFRNLKKLEPVLKITKIKYKQF